MNDNQKTSRSRQDLFAAVTDLLVLAVYIWKVFLKEQRTPGALVFFGIAIILLADLVLWYRFFKGNKKSNDITGGNDHE